MTEKRKCKFCKDIFIVKRKNQRCCSIYCSNKFRIKPRKTLVCAYCGIKYLSRSAKGKKYKNSFCCPEHAKLGYRKLYGTHHKVKCPYCGKKNIKTNQKEKESKYCNTTCSKKHRLERNSFPCVQCGKIMYREPWRQGNSPYYCSPKCYFKSGQPKLNGVLSLKSQHRNRSGLELKGRELLESLGLRYEKSFIEQVPILDQYCVDVYFPRRKLVIQWDGDYWHRNSKKRDSLQKRRLRAVGYKVLRVKESEFKDYEKVKLRVQKFVTSWRDR